MSPSTPIELYINTQSPDIFSANALVLERFLKTTSVQFVDKAPAGCGSLRVRTSEFYVPLGENVDIEAEKAKLTQEITYTEGFIASVDKKLSNEKFVSSAPAAVVDAERKKKADGEAKLKLLRETLAGLN